MREYVEAEMFLTIDHLSKMLTNQGIREGQLSIHQEVEITDFEIEDGMLYLNCKVFTPYLH